VGTLSSSAVEGTAAEVLVRADTLGAISEEPARLTRRLATPALARAGDLVARWMTEAGLTVRRDAIGNVVGRVGNADVPPLVLGSHLDTVPDAGRYDGALGILLALAVVQRLRARDALPDALEVAAFADEEGARFGVPYLGSSAYAGCFDHDWLELVDAGGVTLRDALCELGGDPESLASVPEPRLAGYLEAHIEQGPVLEREGLPVGVVSAIAGQMRARTTASWPAPLASDRASSPAAATAEASRRRMAGVSSTAGVHCRVDQSSSTPRVVAIRVAA